ncbi:MAG: hypothetical protein JJV88_00190 [Sulfurovum sp.]|nr:hypothetical protein [Sulfurovaceae bacterium]
MKKGLLLSVVTSSILMAGGDIAPVIAEPVVVPVIESQSMWDFSGQAVLYYQTFDAFGATDFDMFEQEQSMANAGIQLNAIGNLGNGFGAGFQLTGLGTLGLQESVVSRTMQMAGDELNDAAITKAYLTWGTEGTTAKFGRQDLPKSLSPFAWSEHWNVFQNSYEAALLVNTSIQDTTLVGAWVNKSNTNGIFLGSNLNDFNKLNGSDGVYMITAQNKSINGLTLSGSYYFASEMMGDKDIGADDLNIAWGSAEYTNAMVTAALQGGSVMSDAFEEDTTAVGAKISGNINMFSAEVAYSTVDEGDAGVFNIGGVKTPLYTQMILNQNFIASNADTVTVKGSVRALGGKFIAQYGMTTQNDVLLELEHGSITKDQDYNEFDFIYKTQVGENTTLLAAYVNQDVEAFEDPNNVLRFWARYNF